MWSDEETEPVEASWEEYAQIYRSFEQFMTISEHDRKQTVRVFHIEQDVPAAEDSVLDFVPINMYAAIFIESHKGISWIGCGLFRFSV